jgi:glucose-6-phosphate isomerase
MESLGKMANVNSILKKTSQTIYGGYGPRAQHSFFQMLHQGTSNTCLEIILSNDNLESNKLPKIQALIQNELFNVPVKNNSEQNQRINSNISSNLFTIEKVNPFNLGFLISSWEHKTFISSQLLQINPFDQFGVDEGKNRINKKFF